MAQTRLKKWGQRLLTTLLLLCFIIEFGNSALFAALFSAHNKAGETTHIQSVSVEEIQSALEKTDEYVTYNFEDISPTGETESGAEYKLDPAVAALIDELEFPQDSIFVKRQILEALHEKRLVRLFDYKSDEETKSEDRCQVLVAVDQRSKEIVVIGLNANAETENHVFRLVVIDSAGRQIALDEVALAGYAVARQNDVLPEELAALQAQTDIEVEIISESHGQQEPEAAAPAAEEADAQNTDEQEVAENPEPNSESGSEPEDDASVGEETQPQQVAALTYDVNIISSEETNAESKGLLVPAAGAVVFSGTLGDIRPLAANSPATLGGVKTATKVNGTSDIFRIDLDIFGSNGSTTIGGTPADIVVIVDLSGSMDESNSARWNKTKAALNTLASGILGENVGHQMAMVGYSSKASVIGVQGTAAHRTICPFTTSASTFNTSYNRSTAVGLITEGGIVRGSGTNTHAGFVGAQNLLQARANNGRPKFVILITDGLANYYYTDAVNFTEKLDSSAAINSTANDKSIEVADYIKNTLGASIFSIGVDIGYGHNQDKANYLLRGTASSNDQAFLVNQNDLQGLINTVMQTIVDTPVTVTHGTVNLVDTMSEYIEYQPSYGITAYKSTNGGLSWSAFTGTGTPSISGNVLRWSINNFDANTRYRISYYVKLKPEYFGQKLHKNPTSGTNPVLGNPGEGVIANRATYLTSNAVTTPQHIPVPTVYVPKTVVTPATLTAKKTRASGSAQTGVYEISVLISGTKWSTSDGTNTTYIEQSGVVFTDPMSEFVNYLGNVQLQSANKGSNVWSTITGGFEYNPTTRTITWAIPNFSSDKQYKLTYSVSVNPTYAGRKIHKDQTSGKPANRESGTDGVVANSYTSIKSDLVAEQEVLVPTVYMDNQISVTPATLTGTKTAEAVSGENGLYNIVVTVDGQKRVTVTNGVPSYTDHNNVYLTDPLSEYVDYVGNAYMEWTPKGTETWTRITSGFGYQYFESDKEIAWLIPGYTSDNQYRLVYQVRVKEAYAGAQLHADQVPGKRTGVEPLAGTDGVVANEYTYLQSSLVAESELLVPAVYREPTLVTPPSLQGDKTAARISEQNYEYDVSIVISGEQKVESGYGGNIYTEHTGVLVYDPMSEFVSYLGNPRYEIADKGEDNWQTTTGVSFYDETGDGRLIWSIPEFSSAKQYRVTYRVQVRPEYHNKALHKDQTSGDPARREEGIDGVVANGYTYVTSTLVEEQEILVPAIGDPKPVVTGGELSGEKKAIAIPDSAGIFLIELTFSGTQQITEDLRGDVTSAEHENVTLTDPMSDFVNYIGEPELWIFSETENEWQKLPDLPSYNDTTRTLTWNVDGFTSGVQYKVSYKVQVKDEYAGAQLHKTQTPGAELTPGADGVLANGKTALSSTIVDEYEIMVPAVFRGRIIISPGTADGLKTAQKVADTTGQFDITIEVEGTNYITDGYDGRYERDHNYLYVKDPMSEYVTYLEQYKIYEADVGEDNWQDITSQSSKTFIVFNDSGGEATLQWYVLEFNASQKYKIVYRVQLDPRYYGQAIHKDQTSGDPDFREDGTDGVVANKLTQLSTEIVKNQEILVPTVYEDIPLVEFSFYKVDRAGQPLPGAEFTLYACTKAAEKGHVHSLMAVEGSCWDLEDTLVESSGGNGLVDFGEFPYGQYMLAETNAAPGYALPNGQWLVTINSSGLSFEARYTGEDPPPAFKQENGVFTVANYQFSELPKTGARGIAGTTAAGICLLLLVWLIYRFKCQTETEGVSGGSHRRGYISNARDDSKGKRHRNSKKRKWSEKNDR